MKKPTIKDRQAQRFTSIRPQTGASPAGYHKLEDKLICDQKYKLSQVWGIRKPQFMMADPLAVGSLFHHGRAWWFTNGFPTGALAWMHLKDTIEAASISMELPVRADALKRCLSYLDQYCTYWSSRAKPKVIAVEYDLDHPLLPGLDPRTARLDDVSEYPEAGFKLCIGECKTTSVSVRDVVEEYTLHGQTILQSLLWESALRGARTHGPAEYILLDIIVKGYGKEKCQFGRQPIRITDYTKQWFLRDMAQHVHEASTMTIDTPARRNPASCTRLIGKARVPCQFRDLCQRGRAAAVQYVDREGVSLNHAKYTKTEGPKPWD